MQPTNRPVTARPGPGSFRPLKYSPETGTILSPEKVEEYLRLRGAFTSEDLRTLGESPPARFLNKANRLTLICPLPSSSIQEMATEFKSTHRPAFKMTADHYRQSWVRERGTAMWIRLELTLRENRRNNLRERGERMATAREQVALVLICHENRRLEKNEDKLPTFLNTPALYATSTPSEDGFVVSVGIFCDTVRFMNFSEHESHDKPIVGLRTSLD